MIKRLTTFTALLAMAGVMAFGGVALAQSGSSTHHKKATHHAKKHAVKHATRASASENSASETAGETPGSEVQGSDGPGGHEDEPGAEVDHQFEGEE